MTQWPENPRLDELLADPIVQLAMLADGVDPLELRSQMRDVGRRFAIRRGGFLLAGPATPRREGRVFARGAAPLAAEFRAPLGRRDPCGAATCG